MSYKLAFDQAALQEWKALPDVVRAQFRAKMLERKEHPEIPKDRLSGESRCYKVMKPPLRLVYEVQRDRNEGLGYRPPRR